MNTQQKSEFDKLTKYAEAFYNTGSKLVTDEDFDNLKSAYEVKYKTKFTIGAKVKVGQLVTLSHSYQNLAGTLDKVNSLLELTKWQKRRKLANETKLYWSYKIDGNSLILEYEDGKLVKALTRGENGLGKDLTQYFKTATLANGKTIHTVKPKTKIKKFGIACECTVLYKDFDELISSGEASYNNPRSAIPGILSEDGINLSEYLTLIPFKVMSSEMEDDRALHIEFLEELSPFFNNLDFTINLLEEDDVYTIDHKLGSLYNNSIKTRFDLPFMIDGIVIEAVRNNARKSLGYSDDRPNFAIALKLPYIEAKTNLREVKWFTEGNSARYTPVVYFDPVIINGNTYTKVSLANYKRFVSLKSFSGQEALLTLRGDILGYIDPIKSEKNPNIKFKYSYFKAITNCNFCNEKLSLDKNNVFLSCINKKCQLVLIGNLQNFLEKHNIKGIKRSTLETLYSNRVIKEVKDFFNLDYDKIAKLPGMGQKTAGNIKDGLSYFEKGCEDYKIIGSLNIPFFSTRKAKQVLELISLDEFLMLVSEDTVDNFLAKMKTFKGFKEKIITHIYNGFDAYNLELVLDIIDNTILFNTKLRTEVTDSDTKTLNICVTGSITKFKNRKELENILSKLGHKLVSKVTKTTDILMTNDKTSGTEKNADALKYGTRVLNEDELIKELSL